MRLWILALAFATMTSACSRELPELGRVPTIAFVDQDGQPFGSVQLAGRPYIASFLFTRCPTVCPRISTELSRLQRETRHLGPKLRLVSFTVDPEYDSPARLRTYGQRFGADFTRWHFLTGSKDALRTTIEKGFRLASGTDGHATKLVLVDSRGEIRGYYDSGDKKALDRLVRDAESLIP